MEGGAQVQREQARRQAFDARLAEAMHDVSDVSETEGLKLPEQGNQEQAEQQRRHGTGASEDLPGEESEETSADGARMHLDLLA
ncbi:hypothetical protein GETHLI_24840 [Geothrix limicola]|uniref:Uncharacterized protein n=2 Tax=Geothrix limicola TaxID=2927978 RepID=A0ABQ5QHB1_9BACT|nr:hypothetical protein GETHLI_24840 [Geothrix limicola]